jgi:hypothetical protein
MCPLMFDIAELKGRSPEKIKRNAELKSSPASNTKKAATPASVDDLPKSNPTTPRA